MEEKIQHINILKYSAYYRIMTEKIDRSDPQIPGEMNYNEVVIKFAEADPAGIMYFANYPTLFDIMYYTRNTYRKKGESCPS